MAYNFDPSNSEGRGRLLSVSARPAWEFWAPPIAVGLSLQEYVHHLLALEHRAEEQFLEHWLNPHCKPHCDRNLVHPV